MKVANSIVRKAIPAGVFTGKSKQLYDYLYSVTRGAIVPTRSIRITMDDLMMASGIGSDRTLRKNIRRLLAYGMITVKEIGGTQGGNEFTVLLPEETTHTTPTTGTTTHHQQHNVRGVQVAESERGTGGVSVENKASSVNVKTSSLRQEEKLDDDAALANSSTTVKAEFLPFIELFELLSAVSTEITGKSPQVVDAARWREFGEVLITELRIAAARTAVSSVPAFLAEHLRRRLWKLPKTAATESEKPSGAAPVDASKCPSCRGVGFWYPNGEENGVSRCKHPELSKSGPS
jgi:hypothetical protein